MALSTVGTNALAANAVTSAKITDGTIATGDIADDAITAAKVDPTSVGSEALSSLTVDSIIINGTNIGHTSDTDAISIASSGVTTFSAAVVGATDTDTSNTAGGSGITLSTAASAVDVIPYFVKASNSIQLGAVQKAFS